MHRVPDQALPRAGLALPYQHQGLLARCRRPLYILPMSQHRSALLLLTLHARWWVVTSPAVRKRYAACRGLRTVLQSSQGSHSLLGPAKPALSPL